MNLVANPPTPPSKTELPCGARRFFLEMEMAILHWRPNPADPKEPAPEIPRGTAGF